MMNSETLAEDDSWVAQIFKRCLLFYPICRTLNTKLAATEQSTKHMDARTAWLLALNNITSNAMKHKTIEYNPVWSLL